MIILLLSGNRHGCGKDTVGKFYIDKGFKRVAFADKLKKEYAKYLDISIEELEENKDKYRQGLIAWGASKRTIHQYYWCNQIVSTIDKDYTVITDLRFPNELDFIRSQYPDDDVYCLYVQRELDSTEFSSDKSEQFPATLSDYIIPNNGTIEELYRACESIYDTITGNNKNKP